MTIKKKITIVGAGLMGIGIAQVFASSGCEVFLVDLNQDQLDKVPDGVSGILENFAKYGVKFSDPDDVILGRIKTTTNMQEACSGCDFVFEAVFENMELKQKIIADLDRFCDEKTIICSNTSVMSITEIASKSERKERILGTHWWNPPHLIPLVEVVRTEAASPACVDATFELLEEVGKKPIRVNKDVPGFVANRLQHALWREAFALIDEGVCDAETVDVAVKNGFGMRLPVLGPVENADMVGLDLTFAIHDYILKFLSNNSEPSPTLKAAVEKGNLGFKSGQGFLSWTQDQIDASRSNLSNYLLETISAKEKS
ncbi:MAG: 3-hydroxyacyl-CoA dehydrogenase family protein [Desulfuromusa sp.]|nr:3-hydroxyacyl-CoA dehydrogenase family protein [Desulfuromusa sp.]